MAYQPDPYIASLGQARTPQQIAQATGQGQYAQQNAGAPSTPQISLSSTPISAGGQKGQTTNQYFSGNTPETQQQYAQTEQSRGVSGFNFQPSPQAPAAPPAPAVQAPKAQSFGATSTAASAPVSGGGAAAGGASSVGGMSPAGTSPLGGGTIPPDTALGQYYSRLQPGQAAGPSTDAYSFLTNPQLKSESSLYNQYLGQSQKLLDAINQGYDAQLYQARQQGQQEMGQASSISAAHGLMGTPESAALYRTAGKDTQAAIAQVEGQRAQAIAGVMNNINQLAQSAYQFEAGTLAPQAVQAQQQQLSQSLQGLARAGVTYDQMANSTDPQVASTFANLVQLAGGNPNTLKAQWALNTPNANIQQSWVDGSNVYQLVVDPMTGKATVQNFNVGTNVPVGWKTQKIGTTGLLMYNPNDISQQMTFSINPFTGEISQTGGQGAPSATGGTNATQTPQTTTGVTGATNSGVKATDGGTFASFATPQAGIQAIGDIITSAATGANSAYGSNPTLGSFMNTYTNTGTSSSYGSGAKNVAAALGVDPNTPLSDVVQQQGIGALTQAIIKNEGGSPQGVQNNPGNIKYSQAQTTGAGTGLSAHEYGKLATVQGFNPTQGGVDQASWNYLTQYLNGQTPSASSVGLSTRSGTGGAFNTVVARARDVFYKATGQQLPNQTTLKNNLKLISGNNALANKLNVQTSTIAANFGLNLSNLDANSVNQNAPAINSILDNVLQGLGDPNVAQYVAQNQTLQNEMSSLLAVKNASGTTVADKMEAAGLLPRNASAAQQAQVYKTLMQEAMNADSAVQIANVKLYQQTDPLQLDPGNPLNSTITLTNLKNGESFQADPGQLSATDLQDALNSGYTMSTQ